MYAPRNGAKISGAEGASVASSSQPLRGSHCGLPAVPPLLEVVPLPLPPLLEPPEAVALPPVLSSLPALPPEPVEVSLLLPVALVEPPLELVVPDEALLPPLPSPALPPAGPELLGVPFSPAAPPVPELSCREVLEQATAKATAMLKAISLQVEVNTSRRG